MILIFSETNKIILIFSEKNKIFLMTCETNVIIHCLANTYMKYNEFVKLRKKLLELSWSKNKLFENKINNSDVKTKPLPGYQMVGP